MKTVNLKNKRVKVVYKTNSGMRTKATFAGKLYNQGLSCDVYSIERNNDYLVLVLCGNSEIKKSTTIISVDNYAEILELHDPYHGGQYHTALLEHCGAENHLELH